jgi:hypothetical protein
VGTVRGSVKWAGAILLTIIVFVVASTSIAVVLPEDRYNLYMEFRRAVFFFSNSASIPTAGRLYSVLRTGITAAYLTDVVRTQKGTPFAGVVEGFLAYKV